MLVVTAAVGLVGASPAAGQVREVRGGSSQEGIAQNSGTAMEALQYARSKLGAPYQYGATGPSSFDCSGLVQWAYRQAGVTLKRTTYDQVKQGVPVSRSNLRPGDLVFFYSRVSHVGMYVGGNRMIHAPRPGQRVRIVSLEGHYTANFHSARRVV